MDKILQHAHKILTTASNLWQHPYTTPKRRDAQLRDIMRRANIIVQRIEKANQEKRKSEQKNVSSVHQEYKSSHPDGDRPNGSHYLHQNRKMADYVLKSKNNRPHQWSGGASLNRIRDFESEYGDRFFLVIKCDYGTSNKKVFRIPYSFMKKKVIKNPKVKIEANGDIRFEISKRDFHFNWHRGIRFEGDKFIDPKP